MQLRGKPLYFTTTTTHSSMPTADEIQKQVEKLTAALTKTEAAEEAEKVERQQKLEAKRKAEKEEKEAVDWVARLSKRKTLWFIVLDSESEEISDNNANPDSSRSCTSCIKRGCKCVIVNVSPHSPILVLEDIQSHQIYVHVGYSVYIL